MLIKVGNHHYLVKTISFLLLFINASMNSDDVIVFHAFTVVYKGHINGWIPSCYSETVLGESEVVLHGKW